MFESTTQNFNDFVCRWFICSAAEGYNTISTFYLRVCVLHFMPTTALEMWPFSTGETIPSYATMKSIILHIGSTSWYLKRNCCPTLWMWFKETTTFLWHILEWQPSHIVKKKKKVESVGHISSICPAVRFPQVLHQVIISSFLHIIPLSSSLKHIHTYISQQDCDIFDIQISVLCRSYPHLLSVSLIFSPVPLWWRK